MRTLLLIFVSFVLGMAQTIHFNKELTYCVKSIGDNLLVNANNDEKDFRGITIYEISNPKNPTYKGRYNLDSYVMDIAYLSQSKTLVTVDQKYFSDYTRFESMLSLFDLRNPSSPRKLAQLSLDMPGYYMSLSSQRGLLFVGTSTFDLTIDQHRSRLVIVDISNPYAPKIVGSVATPGYAWRSILSQDERTLYLCDDYKGVEVIDVSNPTRPKIIKTAPFGDHTTVFDIAYDRRNEEFYMVGGIYDEKWKPKFGFFAGQKTEFFPLPLYSLLLDKEQKRAFIGDQNSSIYILNVADSSILQKAVLDGSGDIWNISLSPDERSLYAATKGGLYIVDIDTSSASSVDLATFLISKTFTKAGSFTRYDFPGVDSAFDWIFVTPSNQVYQLQGNPPTSNNVFGWKRVYVAPTITPNSWNMIYLGDYDHDSDTKFDWVLYQNQNYTTSIYKLDGVTATGTFRYKKIEGLKARLEGDQVSFSLLF